MPDSNNDAAIAASAQIADSAINAVSAAKTNRAQRKWTEWMYGQQRTDALADWNRENAYNTPAAQMDRYKAAGLNPLLIYGSGSSAAAAAPIRSSSPGSYNPKAPQVDVGSGIMAYIDTKMKDAQIDNLKTMNQVLTTTAAVKAANLTGEHLKNAYAADTLADREGITNAMRWKLQYGNDQSQKMFPINREVAEAHLKQIQASTNFTLSENQRQATMNTQNLAVAAKRVLLMQAQLEMVPYEKAKLIQVASHLEDDATLKRAQKTMIYQNMTQDEFQAVLEKVVGGIIQGGTTRMVPINIKRR